jgi:hypothetical protein
MVADVHVLLNTELTHIALFIYTCVGDSSIFIQFTRTLLARNW